MLKTAVFELVQLTYHAVTEIGNAANAVSACANGDPPSTAQC